jgi:beta-catenin-like protein 1
MDLSELLSYKPTTSTKRIREDDDEGEVIDDGDVGPPQPKRAGIMPPPSGDKAGRIMVTELTDEEKLILLRNLDNDDIDDVDGLGDAAALDVGSVKKLLLSFEKHVLRNQEMRIKFTDEPDKFMESELELNDAIQSLHIISTIPEHYQILIDANVVSTMCGLLAHDNSDIAIAVVDLLQELTDAITNEHGSVLIDKLLDEQIISLLVQNMERLDEKVSEDSDGVHNTLAIVENLSEIKNKEVTLAAGQQGLLVWLLKRVRVRQFDPNKLYSSEILAILLQDNIENQKILGEVDGVDILLQSLAYYKRRDPHSSNEVELMENLFDCLCSSLMYEANREKFLVGEGLQLMRLMLQSKKMSRISSLKVLDHAMCNREGRDNCNKFISIYGLGSLYPLFMRAPKGGGKDEVEERVISIIASLFRNVKGDPLQRVINKFIENDHEKVDRLLELHRKYTDKVGSVYGGDDAERYLMRLDAGLFTLYLINYIITELCTCGVESINDRITTILKHTGDSFDNIKLIMNEYIEGMGEDDKEEKERLTQLINQIH